MLGQRVLIFAFTLTISLVLIYSMIRAVFRRAEALPEDGSSKYLDKQQVLEDGDCVYSSIFCTSNDPSKRVCRVKNLYYDADQKVFFVVKHPLTSYFANTQVNNTDLRFLDWSSIVNHNTYYWNYRITSTPLVAQKPVRIVKRKVHLMKRFLPNNLMHILHDDWLGAWFIKRHLFPRRELYVFFDDYPEKPIKPFKAFYDFLGESVQYHQLAAKGILKFEDAVVGNSKQLTWYQYGFKKPQGPIEHHPDIGIFIKQAAAEFLKKLSNNTRHPCDVSIFSRTRNRKILNEDELVSRLTQRGLTVEIVRLEEMSMQQIIMQLSSSKCVIGMHGSLFSLIPWLPNDSLVIEIFPFAVPAANYTPYKTLSHALQLKYFPVEIKYRNQTVEHPNRPPLLGGITHLEFHKRQVILQNSAVPPHLCCQDPNWLFRIYQDTIVDVDQLEAIVMENMPFN